MKPRNDEAPALAGARRFNEHTQEVSGHSATAPRGYVNASADDRAWFADRPLRFYRLRPVAADEVRAGVTDSHMLVHQLAPGVRVRLPAGVIAAAGRLESLPGVDSDAVLAPMFEARRAGRSIATLVALLVAPRAVVQ